MALYSKKKLSFLAVAGVALFLLAGWFVFGAWADSPSPESEYVNKVGATTPEKTVRNSKMVYSGTLKGSQETDLSLQAPGAVAGIKAEVGDKVNKGDILAASEGSKQQVQESIKRDYYRNTVQNLEVTKKLMRQQIESARANWEQAKQNLQLVKTSQENEDVLQPEKVQEAEIQLQKAQTEKRNLINSFDQKERDILDNSLSAIRRSAVLAHNSLEFLYSLNNESLSSSDNDFQVSDKFISGRSQLTTDTERQIEKLRQEVEKLRDLYSRELKTVEATPENKEAIISGTRQARQTMDHMEKVLWNMKEILDNSIVHSGLSRQELEGSKTRAAEYIDQVQKMLLSYNGDKAGGLVGVDQAWGNLKTERKNQLATVNNRIELAKQKMELLKSSNSTKNKTLSQKVEVARSRVKKAKQALKTAKSEYDSRIQEMQTRVEKAQGELEAARVGTNDTLLRAPYDGVVTKKYVDQGRVVNAGTPVLRIADVSEMKLVVYVPRNQVGTIQVGDTVTATHEDHSDRQWRARVTNISPASRQNSQKNKVELAVKGTKDLNSGMYMDVSFSEVGKDKVWAVPGRAVFDLYGSSVVYIVDNGRVRQKQVEVTGEYKDSVYLRSDFSGKERIVTSGGSGLSDGDKVQVIER